MRNRNKGRVRHHRLHKKRNKSDHDKRRRSDRKWFRKHPELRPTFCSDCGRDGVLLQFHHMRYDIPRCGRFICEECHMKQHNVQPNQMKREAKRNKYWQFSKKLKQEGNTGNTDTQQQNQ